MIANMKFSRAKVEHIAIIMDGNGRWARKNGLPRSAGHLRGAQAAKTIVRAAMELKIETLTLFCFSSENWERPAGEISYLMNLARDFIESDLNALHEQGVKICVIGGAQNIAPDIARRLKQAEEMTRDNENLRLVIAFNYGGRDEIVRASRRLGERIRKGEIAPDEITESVFAKALDTDWPDPDLIIRTSGERRLSNFLLWQAAYSELVFADCFWPEFGRAQLMEALAEFDSRRRRFGTLSEQEEKGGSDPSEEFDGQEKMGSRAEVG